MKIELERTGGFIGRTVRWSVDTDKLPSVEARELNALVAGVIPGSAPAASGADSYLYRLRVLGGQRPVDVTFGDPVPEAVRPLLVLLRRTKPR